MVRCISFGNRDIQKAMPKKPRFIHPLRQIRDAISQEEKQRGGLAMSQSRFAELLGVSRITIAKIENGDLGVSVAMEARILALTGGLISTGKTTQSEKALCLIEGDYSAESWRSWQDRRKTVSKRSSAEITDPLIQSVRLLMLAAKNANRELDTKACIFEALKKVAHDLKLKKSLERVIDHLPKVKRTMQSGGKHASRIKWPVTDPFSQQVAPILDAAISKLWPDSDEQKEARSQRQGRTRKKL
jgi:DNA-binding XRE family transcriptional regulator